MMKREKKLTAKDAKNRKDLVFLGSKLLKRNKVKEKTWREKREQKGNQNNNPLHLEKKKN